MAVRRVSIGGYVANDDTDTQGQRSTGIKRRTITFDEIKQTAITAPEPFTSPLSCAWLAVVLIGLFVIVTVILTLCYTFKKGRPPLPTSPPVLHVTTPSQESGSQYITVANNSVASSDRDDGTTSSHVT
ncbi:uncharacterized protein [Dermacentor albipictus]|uniref:uncharacterized protein isoform X2 n=1 Tax=Dermacentor albipictus TaxID=60249 RepID=UPI0031FC691B